MVRPTLAEVRSEARRIHRCPEGYDGPCWGATQRDLEVARENLRDGSKTAVSGRDAAGEGQT
jgi:hypothetical protein